MIDRDFVKICFANDGRAKRLYLILEHQLDQVFSALSESIWGSKVLAASAIEFYVPLILFFIHLNRVMYKFYVFLCVFLIRLDKPAKTDCLLSEAF